MFVNSHLFSLCQLEKSVELCYTKVKMPPRLNTKLNKKKRIAMDLIEQIRIVLNYGFCDEVEITKLKK